MVTGCLEIQSRLVLPMAVKVHLFEFERAIDGQTG